MTVIDFIPTTKETATKYRSGSLGNVQARLDEFWAARGTQTTDQPRVLTN